MSYDWFYADSQNQQQGPVADSWLVSAYQRGEVRASTLVWREGLAAWVPLSLFAGELGLPLAASPPPLSSGRPSRTVVTKPSSNNTWVIVVIVVIFGFLFVGGILAAIAIPAYQDYVQRAKISEALMLASDLKLSVAEFFESQKRCPSNGDDTFLAADKYATPTIAAIKIGSTDSGQCAVQVLFKNLGRGTEGKELLLTMDAQGNWRTTSNLPNKYLPSSLRNSGSR